MLTGRLYDVAYRMLPGVEMYCTFVRRRCEKTFVAGANSAIYSSSFPQKCVSSPYKKYEFRASTYHRVTDGT